MSDLGEITRCYTVTFVRKSHHPAARLWRAISDPGEVTQWMAYPARIDLRVGGDYHVDFERTAGGALDGVIVRVEPERRLAYVWGLSVLEWTLEPLSDGCRFTFRHHGQVDPGDADEDIAAGWHLWLDALDAHLGGGGWSAEQEQEAWHALVPAYRERRAAVLRRA